MSLAPKSSSRTCDFALPRCPRGTSTSSSHDQRFHHAEAQPVNLKVPYRVRLRAESPRSRNGPLKDLQTSGFVSFAISQPVTNAARRDVKAPWPRNHPPPPRRRRKCPDRNAGSRIWDVDGHEPSVRRSGVRQSCPNAAKSPGLSTNHTRQRSTAGKHGGVPAAPVFGAMSSRHWWAHGVLGGRMTVDHQRAPRRDRCARRSCA